jgi:hypothetical protein
MLPAKHHNKNDLELQVASTNPAPPSPSTGTSLRAKILVYVTSLIFLFTILFGIYFLATFDTVKHCMICTEIDGTFSIIAPFVWWSNWTFVTTTITWAVWVWRKVIKNISPQDSLFLIELSLPLSIFVMIGYTMYLVTSGLGDDLVDDEVCHRVLDLCIPKEATSEFKKNAYLSLAFLTTICMHYLCAIVNVVLYLKYYKRRAWTPFAIIGLITVLSIIVVLAQEVGHVVIYCTNNIYMVASVAVIMCTIIHALFFHPRLSMVKRICK